MSEKEDSTLSPRGEPTDEQARAAAERIVARTHFTADIDTVARAYLSLRSAPPPTKEADPASPRDAAQGPLLPCPFDGEMPFQPIYNDVTKTWFVLCDECQCEGPSTSTEAEAIAAWNKRSPPPVLSNWREIETAPKDGTRILADLEDGEGIEIIEWEADGWKGPGWVHSTGKWSAFPIRWWPLPAPPGAGGDEDKEVAPLRSTPQVQDGAQKAADHTPTPWRVQDNGIFFHGSGWRELIATTSTERVQWRANAEHIVRCVNAHAELMAALCKIEKWFGEFPPTGKTWPESGEPMSYATCYGSNGERDYMRRVARAAIAAYQKVTAGEPRGDSEHPSAEDGGASERLADARRAYGEVDRIRLEQAIQAWSVDSPAPYSHIGVLLAVARAALKKLEEPGNGN